MIHATAESADDDDLLSAVGKKLFCRQRLVAVVFLAGINDLRHAGLLQPVARRRRERIHVADEAVRHNTGCAAEIRATIGAEKRRLRQLFAQADEQRRFWLRTAAHENGRAQRWIEQIVVVALHPTLTSFTS